jgi:NAD(P)-dependent dehydrogenase (short-subunit alcohol dehydrogenase family)
MSVKGRIYTVTGSASGIGLTLTLLLVEEGATVYGSDVNRQGLEETAKLCIHLQYSWSTDLGESLPGKFVAMVLDIRNDDSVKSWIKSLVAKEGRLDGAANVAGVSGSDKPTNTENIVTLPLN